MADVMISLLAMFCLVFAPAAGAEGKIKVVATLPDLAEVVRDIGGDRVDVSSLLSGPEDAHFMDASPAFVLKVARAQVVCLVGLELEIGWLPKVLSKSGNADIQPGGKGYCDTGAGIDVLEKPTGPTDRSMGDVHPAGNPHFTLSPAALSQAAVVIEKSLARVQPDQEAFFQARLKAFQARMTKLKNEVAAILKPVTANKSAAQEVIQYHKEFTYFFTLYGIKSFGTIEEKPGVPPSAARLARQAAAAKGAHVRLALGALHSPEKHLIRFQELSGIPYQRVPSQVQLGDENWNSIEKLQKGLARIIVKALSTP